MSRSIRILVLLLLAAIASGACALFGAMVERPPTVSRRDWVTTHSRVALLFSGTGIFRDRYCIRPQAEPRKSERVQILQGWWLEFLATVPSPALYDGPGPARSSSYRDLLSRIDGALNDPVWGATPAEGSPPTGVRGILLATPPGDLPDLLVVDAAGWPFSCMQCETRLTALVSMPPHYSEELSGGVLAGALGLRANLLAGSPLTAYRTVPLRVLWPGLLMSVASWAATFALAGLLSRFVRRLLWLRARRCVGCGIRLLPSQCPCPECGRSTAATG